jgi:flagellar basal body-associated protein FliL
MVGSSKALLLLLLLVVVVVLLLVIMMVRCFPFWAASARVQDLHGAEAKHRVMETMAAFSNRPAFVEVSVTVFWTTLTSRLRPLPTSI